MSEPTTEVIKYVLIVLAGPVLALIAWLGRRLHNRVDELEQDVNEIDKRQAVQDSQLKDIKDDVHSINRKLDKILDKLSK